MSKNNKCNKCGQILEDPKVSENTEIIASNKHVAFDKERLINEIKTQVLSEVQKNIEPLLIKLKEITEQRNQTGQVGGDPQQQIQQMQADAHERLKTREQNIKLRMTKWKNRIEKRT